jgi:hypothetical protein
VSKEEAHKERGEAEASIDDEQPLECAPVCRLYHLQLFDR